MNVELLETNRFIKENLKLLWKTLIERVYLILIDDINLNEKINKYKLYLHNYGLNNIEIFNIDKSFLKENNINFEIAVHHKIYETAFYKNETNILVLEENFYFDEDKEKIRKILENLTLTKKKYIFQNKDLDFIYLGNFPKGTYKKIDNNLMKTKYSEYNFAYIINLECRKKLYKNNENELNCFTVFPLFVFYDEKKQMEKKTPDNFKNIEKYEIVDNSIKNKLITKVKDTTKISYKNYSKIMEKVSFINPLSKFSKN
jgi:hypothetical protein